MQGLAAKQSIEDLASMPPLVEDKAMQEDPIESNPEDGPIDEEERMVSELISFFFYFFFLKKRKGN